MTAQRTSYCNQPKAGTCRSFPGVLYGPLILIICSAIIAAFSWKVNNLPLPAEKLIRKGLAGIQKANPDDFKFVVFGDSHKDMATLGAIIRQANADPSISFVISVGDMVSDSFISDFRIPIHQIQKLKVPFLCAIGNHDRDIANRFADPIYRGIFGNTYYSFRIGNNYFAMLDGSSSHGLEPDQLKWLTTDLAGTKGDANRFVFCHTPMRDPRGAEFSQCMHPEAGNEMLAIFKQANVTHLFSGHIHGYFSGEMEGVPYTITGGGGGRLDGKTPDHFFHEYVVVSVRKGVPSYEMKRIEEADLHWADRLMSLKMLVYHRAGHDGFLIASIALIAGMAWIAIVMLYRRKKARAI